MCKWCVCQTRVFVYIHTYSWSLCVYTNIVKRVHVQLECVCILTLFNVYTCIYTVGVCVYTVTMSYLSVCTCQLTQVSVQINLIPMQPLILGMRLVYSLLGLLPHCTTVGTMACTQALGGRREKELGIYCLCMCVIIPLFRQKWEGILIHVIDSVTYIPSLSLISLISRLIPLLTHVRSHSHTHPFPISFPYSPISRLIPTLTHIMSHSQIISMK